MKSAQVYRYIKVAEYSAKLSSSRNLQVADYSAKTTQLSDLQEAYKLIESDKATERANG